MREELTPRQQELYDFIATEISVNGYAPALREMMKHLGLASTNAIRQLVGRLIEKGYIHRTPKIARGLVLTDADYLKGETGDKGTATEPLSGDKAMRIARIWYNGTDWCGYMEDEEQRFANQTEECEEQRQILQKMSDLGATHYRYPDSYGEDVKPIEDPNLRLYLGMKKELPTPKEGDLYEDETRTVYKYNGEEWVKFMTPLILYDGVSFTDPAAYTKYQALRSANETLKTKLSDVKAVNAELKEEIGRLKKEWKDRVKFPRAFVAQDGL